MMPDAENVVIAVALARRVAALRYPECEVAILAGSRARGSASASSDYDIVLLFASLPDGAWRQMIDFEGEAVELFAHDIATFSYFCREVDRPSGLPVLPRMMVEGLVATGAGSTLLARTRQIAVETLAAGPPPLNKAELDGRRFAISELREALASDRPRDVQLAAGATLYPALADFALRSVGEWSAAGKAIPEALRAFDPEFCNQFQLAFDDLFARSETEAVRMLIDAVLKPHGGSLRVGFEQSAPRAWRDG